MDPLFKKTCADFDEGGARGLLLNHLNMFGDGRIVLDASDIGVDIQGEQVAYEDPSVFEKKMDISGILGRSLRIFSDI